MTTLFPKPPPSFPSTQTGLSLTGASLGGAGGLLDLPSFFHSEERSQSHCTAAEPSLASSADPGELLSSGASPDAGWSWHQSEVQFALALVVAAWSKLLLCPAMVSLALGK